MNTLHETQALFLPASQVIQILHKHAYDETENCLCQFIFKEQWPAFKLQSLAGQPMVQLHHSLTHGQPHV